MVHRVDYQHLDNQLTCKELEIPAKLTALNFRRCCGLIILLYI
jgi:hypothetical protein